MKTVSLTLAACIVGLAACEAQAGQYYAFGPGGPLYGRFGPGGYLPRHLPRGTIAVQHRGPGRPSGEDIAAGILTAVVPLVLPQLRVVPAGPPVPPAAAPGAPLAAAPPEGALAEIEPNPRGITRAEVEAALIDWCGQRPEAPLCVKLGAAAGPR
jgi:hypothetical protein